MAESDPSAWRQLIWDIDSRDLTAVQQSLESGACAHHIISEPGFRHSGVTPLSVAIASEDIELVRVMIKYSPPLTFRFAIENDYKLQKSDGYISSPVSEQGPNRTQRNYALWWSRYQALDSSSVALASLLRTRGRLYAEEQDDSYHSLYKQEELNRSLTESLTAGSNGSEDVATAEQLNEDYDVKYGEEVFMLLVQAGLDLSVAHSCDIGRSLWFWAIQEGHVQAVRMILKAGFPIDLRATKTGYHSWRSRAVAPLCTTGLWNAAFRAQNECLALLLEERASVQVPEINKEEFSETTKSKIPTLEYEPWSLSMSPILAAAHGLYLQQISYDAYWWRPSRKAVGRDRYSQTVVLLLKAGADPNPTSKTATPAGMYELSPPVTSPMLLLVEQGAVKAVSELLSCESIMDSFGEHQRSALHLAVRSQNLEMTTLVSNLPQPCIPFDNPDEFGYTPLHECVLSGSLEIMTFLLEAGAQVDPISQIGLSPLWLAIVMKRKDMVQLLLEHHANPNLDCSQKLSNVTEPGQSEIELLIEHLTHDKSKRRTDDKTVYWAATPLLAALGEFKAPYFMRKYSLSESYKQTQNESLEMRLALVQLLLEHGGRPMQEGLIAKIGIQDPTRDVRVKKRWCTWQAQYCVPVVHAIRVVFGTDQEAGVMPRPSYQTIEELLLPVRSQIPKIFLDRALQVACDMDFPKQYGDCSTRQPNGIPSRVLEPLLSCGANPNIRSNHGGLPLHKICAAYLLTEERIQDQLYSVDLLLRFGARVEERDNHGRTPLHFAVLSNVKVTRALLEKGLSPYDSDDTQNTPMHYACGVKWAEAQRDTAMELCRHMKWQRFITPGRWFLNSRQENPFHGLATFAGLPHEEHMNAVKFLLNFFEPHTNCLSQFNHLKQTPMHIAAASRYYSPAGLLFLQAVCSESRPFDAFTTQDAEGRTPLIAAVRSGSRENVSTLLLGISRARPVKRLDETVAPNPMRGDPFQFIRFRIIQSRHTAASEDSALEKVQEKRRMSKQTLGKSPNVTEGINDLDEKRGAAEEHTDSNGGHPPNLPHTFPSAYVSQSHFQSRSKPPEHLQNADLRFLRAQSLNTRDNYNATALQHAVAEGHVDIVKLLLHEEGIDTHCYDGKHATLLKLAATKGYEKVKELLEEFEATTTAAIIASEKTKASGRSSSYSHPLKLGIIGFLLALACCLGGIGLWLFFKG